MKTDHSDKRVESRLPIKKECLLTNGFGMLTASAVDISKKGLGLFINREVPFKKSDKLFVSLGGKISRCQVKWVRALNKTFSKAGLKYFQDSFRP